MEREGFGGGVRVFGGDCITSTRPALIAQRYDEGIVKESDLQRVRQDVRKA